jgi:hypothetical protein
VPLASRCATALCGGTARRTAGGRASATPVPARGRNFTAGASNRLWLADITEHPTGEGKLYLLRHQGRVLEPHRGLVHRLALSPQS